MAYEQEIVGKLKGCIIFLADQSYSMIEPIGGSGDRKCDELAWSINAWLQNLVIRMAGDERIYNWIDVGVIGYRTDKQDNPVVGSLFSRWLPDRTLALLSEVHANTRIVTRLQILPDEESGEVKEELVEVPIWIDPVAEGGTPMCHALHMAYGVAKEWAEAHADCFPPIVLNITDGETTDGGNPLEYAAAIKSLATNDGNVLLFNCHLSATASDPLMFVSSQELLPDAFSRLLYQMSSELPEPMRWAANAKEGWRLKPGARGMVYNADMVGLLKFLNIDPWG